MRVVGSLVFSLRCHSHLNAFSGLLLHSFVRTSSEEDSSDEEVDSGDEDGSGESDKDSHGSAMNLSVLFCFFLVLLIGRVLQTRTLSCTMSSLME